MSRHDSENARQGSKGTRILIVLIAALAVAAIVAVFMGFFGASQPDTDPALEAGQEAPATQSGESSDGEMVSPEQNDAEEGQ